MSEPTLSAYVQRCQVTMAEYARLRFLGVSHDMARRQSGFEEAVMERPFKPEQAIRDVRKIVSGEAE